MNIVSFTEGDLRPSRKEVYVKHCQKLFAGVIDA